MTGPFRIRPAVEADWPAVLTINAAGTPGVSALTPEELCRLATEAAYFHVAEAGAAVVGYLLGFTPGAAYEGEEFGWFRRHAPPALYVDQVAVARSWRGRGVASLLYGHAAAFALARGLCRLSCEINLRPPNPVSERFHRARGFRSVGTLETSDGRLVSLQLRDLAPPAPA